MSREQLQQYIDAGQYVFHGTSNGEITELEPRQAMSHQKPDGEPAIFAAASIEPAIFMAILGSRKVAGWNSDEFSKPFGFYIAESHWRRAQAEQWRGFVYVLKRDSFTKGTGWVWRATQPVVPEAKAVVSFNDLPDSITILSDTAEAAYLERNS